MLLRSKAVIALCATMLISLCCATTGGPVASRDTSQDTSQSQEGSFQIAANESKTVFVERQGEKYKILRVEKGDSKADGTIVFTYIYNPDMQILSVMHHLDENMITYDCYQVVGKRERQTSIVGAFKNIPTTEMWYDGIKLLRITNIRVAK